MSMGRRMVHERRRHRDLIPAERRTGYEQRDHGDRRARSERRWSAPPPLGTSIP
jgi:hypothetical protein